MFSSFRCSNLANLPISSGKAVNWLLLRFRVLNSVNLPISSAGKAVNWLLSRFRVSKLVNLPISSAGKAVNWLLLRFRYLNLVKLPISFGKVVNWLFSRSRLVKLVNLPISFGKVVNWLLERYRYFNSFLNNSSLLFINIFKLSSVKPNSDKSNLPSSTFLFCSFCCNSELRPCVFNVVISLLFVKLLILKQPYNIKFICLQISNR